MSKKTILITVLALCMVLVGTGYAYWTDTLNVTTKATTGDLDVTFVDLGAYAQYDNEGAETNGWWSIIDGIGEDGYVNAGFWYDIERYTKENYNDVFGNGTTIEDKRPEYYGRANGYNQVVMEAELKGHEDLLKDYPSLKNLPYAKAGVNYSDTISIELYNMYPGYAQAFRSDIINVGSIAAKLSTIDFNLSKIDNVDVTNDLKSLIGVALLVQDEDYGQTHGEKWEDSFKLAALFEEKDIFELGGVEFVRLTALDGYKAEAEEDEDFKRVILAADNPNREHRADLFIGIAVDPDPEGTYTSGTAKDISGINDARTQNKGIQFDIKFGWDQFNAEFGVHESITNILEQQNGNAQ